MDIYELEKKLAYALSTYSVDVQEHLKEYKVLPERDKEYYLIETLDEAFIYVFG